MPDINHQYKIIYEGDLPAFLGAAEDLPQDVRESNGRTHYISASNNKTYQDFRWMIDGDGRIYIVDK